MSEHCESCGCRNQSEEFVEDMPMCRHTNPIHTCAPKCASSSGCQEELEQILAALACQNQLLVDLLGAVNCLTAALLAERPTCRPKDCN